MSRLIGSIPLVAIIGLVVISLFTYKDRPSLNLHQPTEASPLEAASQQEDFVVDNTIEEEDEDWVVAEPSDPSVWPVDEELDDTPFYVFLDPDLHPEYKETVRYTSRVRFNQIPLTFSKLGVEMHVMDSYSDYLGEIEYIASMEEERFAYLRADRPKLPVGLWDVEVWRIRPVAHGLEVMVEATYFNSSEERFVDYVSIHEWWLIPSDGSEPTLIARDPEGRDFYKEAVQLD
jgi:hypothetical protein